MARHRVAACAAALALATCVDAGAGAPAFAVVRDAGAAAQGGGAVRPAKDGAKGGLAPKMVAGPQDYLTSLEAGKTAHAHWAAASSGDDSRDKAAEGAERFYSLERINNAKAFLDDLTQGVVDPTLLAQDFEYVGASPGTVLSPHGVRSGKGAAGVANLHGFSLDASDPNRVWFHAQSPSSQAPSAAQRGWIAFNKNGLVAKVSMETAGDAQPDDTPPSQAGSVMTRVFEMLGEKTGAQQVHSRKWSAPVGYVPRATTAVHAPASEAQVQGASAKKWEPYGGYNPASRGVPPYAPAGAGASESVQGFHGTRDGHSGPASSMPAKKWESYGGTDSWNPPTGYVPSGSRIAPVGAPVQLEGPAQPDAARITTGTQSSAPAKRWSPPIGYVPKQQVEAVASEARSWKSPTGYVPGWASQMGDNSNIAPSAWDTSAEARTDAQSNAPAKKWEPYGGYDPKNRGASAAPAASVSAAGQGRETWAAATASISSGSISSMPAKKWVPYGGYDPKSRGGAATSAGASGTPVKASGAEQGGVGAPSSTDTQGSAPAKKWEPYGGYDPKSRGSTAAAASMRAQVQAYEPPPAVSSLASETQSSAAKKLWEPYTGYEPTRRSSPASPTTSASAISQSSDPLSSAPAKTWTPPTGYVPSRHRHEQATESTQVDASSWPASSLLEGVKQITTTLFQNKKTQAPADNTRHNGVQLSENKAVSSKGKEIFRVLVNALTLSKTLCELSGANDQEVKQTEQDGAASEPLTKREELFKTLFNCLVLSQTALHHTLTVNGAISSNVVKTRGQTKLEKVFTKSYPATAREAARK